MESMHARKKGSSLPSKRRQNEDEKGKNFGSAIKKPALDLRYKPLLGRYVFKKFEGRENFLGKIVGHSSGLYRVCYEDGNCEDLDSGVLSSRLLGDEFFYNDLSVRRRELDELVSRKILEKEDLEKNKVDMVEEPALRELKGELAVESKGIDGKGNVSSLKDSFEPLQEALVVQPSELPPSSGTVGVPDEYVSHLFLVYTFLRSFSISLFLSPFTLDDLVGAINCRAQNTLIDSIHVALMQAIKRHLQTLSSDGSEIASKCLRCVDWSLLDLLTWPIFLVYYFSLMGYVKGPKWKGFHDDLLNGEYYSSPVRRKLMILQILCDNVLDSSELRTEIDTREGSEAGVHPDAAMTNTPESVSRRVHPRNCKTSTSKGKEVMEIIRESNGTKPSSSSRNLEGNADFPDVVVDGNGSECMLCSMDGVLLCCDSCPSVYHSRCIGVVTSYMPEGEWYCPECTINKLRPTITTTSLKAAEIFGIDIYEQVFFGTCDHLLIASVRREPCLRYYNQKDIPKVLQVLVASVENRSLYSEISKAIARHWNIPETAYFPLEATEKGLNIESVEEDGSSAASLPSAMVVYQVPDASADPCVIFSNGDAARTQNGSNSELVNGNCVYMGTSFEPHGYINHYMHGDFPASAAATLAIQLPKDSRVSEVHRSSNARKAASDISMQMKAFSTAASRFFWPGSERKLMDMLSERCGWCYSCKPGSNIRRGCILNAAASTATRGTMKVLSRIRPIFSGEGSLPSISTYILYMGEALHGLSVGTFQSRSSRQQWRKQLEKASTCSAVKCLLLELEDNIRNIALSGDWVKARDDWVVESSTIQGAASTIGTTQKRGPSGKRSAKQSAIPEVTADKRDKDFTWWRGGMLFKHVFHKAILPQTVAIRAARQSGSKKITGIQYGDDSKIPKRSKQLVWRAAVEKCKNASQLALQVRYLDLHVRWNELVRPEQNLQDGKGLETEASIFRNAVVIDKKVEENKIRYGLAFRGQGHLPPRITRNVIEIEEIGSGMQKYWFSETHVPLYLMKEYEQDNKDEASLPTLKAENGLSKLQRRQLKASRRDMFLYLTAKRDGLVQCFCASCGHEVFLRDAVKCSDCEGYCHNDCTVNSTINPSEEVEILITCQKCCNAKALYSNVPPTSSLPMQEMAHHNTATVNRGRGIVIHNQPVPSIGPQEYRSRQVSSSSVLASRGKGRLCNWGVILKRKNSQDTGVDFRKKNILLGGSSDETGLTPVCNLCNTGYDPNLMYIHCLTCSKWYHADAVGLEEARLSAVVGFKCCRCRRIRPPTCPHKEEEVVRDDDPLLFSLEKVIPITEQDSIPHVIPEE